MTNIGIFGKRNSGKSSIINSLTEQDLAIVSDIPGTTTDPVKKTVEIFGIGPVTLIDTAGIDDNSILGNQRVKKTLETIDKIDFAILVISQLQWTKEDEDLVSLFKDNGVSFMIVHNKSDIKPLAPELKKLLEDKYQAPMFEYSTLTNEHRNNFLEAIQIHLPPTKHTKNSMFDGLIKPEDIVLLVTPIDSEAPTGRMILPQMQAVRSLLDNNAIVVDCQVSQISKALQSLNVKPALVVTDSQAFAEVVKLIPESQKLTSFSILLAKQKGFFEETIQGTKCIENLKDGDKVLILESCTHQTSCDDIGRVKLPRLLTKYTGKNLQFEFISGLSPLPENIAEYALAIQCGGCMVTARQINIRLRRITSAGVPVSNYGMSLAYVNGIFNRSLQPF
ncbi:[FeFe] hydrogenase H-cluster maturation GTPase HydF [Bacteroidia bacterium]|nr:[FeFe] hydrogenase H-cluster maturation GTPase HydF [Bacteroidia bacterium]